MDPTAESSVSPSIWATPPDQAVLLDEECSPTKTCRNMVGVSFDGLAEPGTDLAQSWRDRLAREGKIAAGSASIADLVLENPGS